MTGTFVISNDGLVFSGDLDSHIDRQTYLFGQYEEYNINLFLGCVQSQRNGVILDIGANVGTHSLVFSQHFEQVHAFEPNPQLWAQFDRNVRMNGFSNITLHGVGLGDEDAELPFYMIEKRNYGLGTFLTVEQYDLPIKRVATCRVANGDGYLRAQGIAAVDAIKIDVQGFEPAVLRGLSATLRQYRPLVWFEYGSGTQNEFRTLDELRELFPYDIRIMHMNDASRRFTVSAALEPVTAELPLGDYVIAPK